MNIFFLLSLLSFTNVVTTTTSLLYMRKKMNDKFSFLYNFTHLYTPITNAKNHIHSFVSLQENKPSPMFFSKINSYLRLIRYKNILPTIGLSYTGAFLVNPSFYTITSKILMISTLIIMGAMSSSMIMNDLFDMKIDKINNPNRPLITGEISEKEAHIVNAAILVGVELLNIFYLPRYFQNIIHVILFSLFIYTPKIKKITFLKNIYCAFIVSFASYFSAILYSTSLTSPTIQNIGLLKLFSQTVFLGSLFNEILLDIRDCEGDYVNNVRTLPVIYGNSNALMVSSGTLKMNFMWNMYHMIELFGLQYALFVPFIFLPMMYGVKKIRNSDYIPTFVMETVDKSTKSLLFLLMYYSFIATTKKW